MNVTCKDIISVVFRYRLSLLLFSAYLLIALSLYVFVSKKMYQSQAEILVRFGQEQLGSSTLGASDRNIYITRRNEEIQNEIRILTSSDTLFEVAKTIAGETATPIQLLKLRSYLQNHLEASALQNSDVVEISFNYPDPFVAQRVLGIILSQYQKHHGQVYFDPNELALLEKELKVARDDYSAALEAVASFEKKHKVFDDKQIIALNETRERQQLLLNTLINEYAYAQQKLEELQVIVATIPHTVLYSTREVKNEQYERLAVRLSEALVLRERLRGKYTDQSREVAEVNKEITLLQSMLKKEPERRLDDKESRTSGLWESVNKQLLDLTPEVKAQKVRIASLRKQIEETEADIQRASSVKGQYILLVKDMELKKVVYDKYHQSLSTALGRGAAQQQTITNTTIVEHPSFNPLPITPNKKKMIVFGMLLLIAGNAALLFIHVFTDTTVSTPRQAEKAFGLPVVGTFVRNTFHPLANRVSHVPAFERYKKNYRQMYLKLQQQANQPSCILFCAAEASCLYVELVNGFASFAQRYQYKKPVIVRYVQEGDAGNHALPETALTQIDEVAVYTRSSLVSLDSEKAFWHSLRADFDLFIFDYAPIYEETLLIACADVADVALYAIQAEETNRFVAKHNIESLQQFGMQNILLVLNDRKLHIPNILYRYL